MASNFDDTSLWRLTSVGATVPIKFLSIDGAFEKENGTVVFRALILAEDLVPFLIETFPPTIYVGNVALPQSTSLPGLPGLIARKVSFKSQDDGRPSDPFGLDPSAPEGTYHPVVEVSVEYGPREGKTPQSTNPFTFLELSANHSGEVINTTSPKAKWQTQTRDPTEPSDDADPAGDPDTPPNQEKPAVEGTKETVKDPSLAIIIQVPQTEWSVKWNQIPFAYFSNVLIHRLRWALGRVNSTFFPLLFNAYPETVLLTGFSYSQQYTWRDGLTSTPPINVEMKFVEKRVVWNGVILGHNHFWRPSYGWQKLLIDGTNPTYQSRNFNVIFQV